MLVNKKKHPIPAVVVIAFFLCWTPFHAQRLGYVYFKDAGFFRTINEWLMYASGVLYYVSSTINPILYNLMSVRYRQAFKKTLCGAKSTLHLEIVTQHHHNHHGHLNGGSNGHLRSVVRGRTNTWDNDQGRWGTYLIQLMRSLVKKITAKQRFKFRNGVSQNKLKMLLKQFENAQDCTRAVL